jgi:hypothetical protein
VAVIVVAGEGALTPVQAARSLPISPKSFEFVGAIVSDFEPEQAAVNKSPQNERELLHFLMKTYRSVCSSAQC